MEIGIQIVFDWLRFAFFFCLSWLQQQQNAYKVSELNKLVCSGKVTHFQSNILEIRRLYIYNFFLILITQKNSFLYVCIAIIIFNLSKCCPYISLQRLLTVENCMNNIFISQFDFLSLLPLIGFSSKRKPRKNFH